MPADVGVLDDRGVGVGHAGPPLEHGVVLVGDGAHHRADVEGLLAVRVGLGGEDLADGGEVAALDRVRVRRDVAVGRVGRRQRDAGRSPPARRRCARSAP